MNFQDQTACVKCMAMMPKELRICPKCGATQSSASGTHQRATSTVGRPPTAYKTPSSYNTRYNTAPGNVPPASPPPYMSPPGTKNGSPWGVILCSVVAIGSFVTFLIANAPRNAPVITSSPTSTTSTEAALPPSKAPVARNAPVAHPAESNIVLSPAQVPEAFNYCKALDFDILSATHSLEDFAHAIDLADHDQELALDPQWKSSLIQKQEQLHQSTSLFNTLIVPPECTALQSKVLAFGAMTDKYSKEMVDSMVNGNMQEVNQAAIDQKSASSLLDSIERDEKHIHEQYMGE